MAAEWVAAISVLIFPTFVVVLSLLQVPNRQAVTQMASSEAARAYVQALDASPGQADTAARAAVVDVISSQLGRSETEITNAVANNTIRVEKVGSEPYCPGNEITFRVSMPLPVSINPFDPGQALFHVPGDVLASTATERIDDYAEIVNIPGSCP